MNKLDMGDADSKHFNLCFPVQGSGKHAKGALQICSIGLCIRETASGKEIRDGSSSLFSVKMQF